MGRFRSCVPGSRGFTLMEIMIAGGLLAFIAVAVLPAVFSLTKGSGSRGFKSQCASIVRAKLQEYMNGVSDQDLWPTAGGNYIPTGFEYTKRRYQEIGQGRCETNVSNLGQPGFRERVYSNQVFAAPNYYGQETDLSRELLGFQLFVMIRHYNPRVLSAGGQPSRACPPNNYQFLQVGDALEVTVTGMIRTSPTVPNGGRGGLAVGDFRDLNGGTPHPDLTCSSTDVVYPPVLPFRYYMSPEGTLYNLQAKLSESSGDPTATPEASQAHFRSVWSSSQVRSEPDNPLRSPTSGITSIAISPDNRYVWVVRSSELARYGPCTETTQLTVALNFDLDGNGSLESYSYPYGDQVSVKLTSISDAKSFRGIPDCPPLPSINEAASPPDGLVWRLPTNIERIAVNFNNPASLTDDAIYGMTNVGGGSAGTALLKATLSGSAPWTATFADTTDFALPLGRPRITGFYITQNYPAVTAPTLFFFDNECYTPNTTLVSTEGRYCTTFYSASDTNMQQSHREMPVQVEAVTY